MVIDLTRINYFVGQGRVMSAWVSDTPAKRDTSPRRDQWMNKVNGNRPIDWRLRQRRFDSELFEKNQS